MRDYFETFFRHKWLFFVPLLTVFVLALAGGYYTSKQFESHASLWVSNTTALDQSLTALSLNQPAPGQTHLAQIQGLMQTDSFLTAVINASPNLKDEIGGSSATAYETEMIALRKNVQIFSSAPNLIQISYKDKQQAASFQVVEGIVNQYKARSLEQQQKDLTTTAKFLSDQYKTLQETTNKANLALADFEKAHPVDTRTQMSATDDLEYQRLQSEYKAALDRQNQVYDAQQKAQFSLSKLTASLDSEILIADPATHPESAALSTSRLSAIALLGLVVGVGLGFTCVAMVTWFGRKPSSQNNSGAVPAWVDRLLQPEVEM